MQFNILKDSGVVKITLTYMVSGLRKKTQVRMRFMDKKECYFATENRGFVKPKNKTNIEIACYTPDGVYKSNVTLMDTITSMNEILFSVSIPYIWKLSQMRMSSRKQVKLPIKIRFNDGFEITSETHDVSLGGVSFYSEQAIPSIYKQLTCVLSMKLPQNTVVNFANGQMSCEARYQREKEDEALGFLSSSTLYVFKFLTMTNDDIIVLKNFLLHLDGAQADDIKF